MNVVCAEKQELADIYQLEHALFGDHAYPLFFFRQAFDCWGKGLLVAKQDSQVAGYVLMTPTDKQQEYWVLSLAVDPNNSSACELYLSMGFVTIKEEGNYFGDDEPRLVMQLIV
ncbi:GNAT family N-acetyltransferase [Vibrio splendidus]|uniref:GNAT family N-acetyltransferase n=1 Tax=Vibrio splendidus TaxID=29497 RepID=UPI000D349F13|nr:GNAT family N-acetyltransferase [Vibrio splendidus]PTQ15984.1 GNAT family N-acetyltransferase [Vibrio splendidus]